MAKNDPSEPSNVLIDWQDERYIRLWEILHGKHVLDFRNAIAAFHIFEHDRNKDTIVLAAKKLVNEHHDDEVAFALKSHLFQLSGANYEQKQAFRREATIFVKKYTSLRSADIYKALVQGSPNLPDRLKITRELYFLVGDTLYNRSSNVVKWLLSLDLPFLNSRNFDVSSLIKRLEEPRDIEDQILSVVESVFQAI